MLKSKKFLFGFSASIVVLLIASVYFFNSNQKPKEILELTNTEVAQMDRSDVPELSLVAKKLEVSWSMVFLPDGNMLLTERPGRVRLIDKNGVLQEKVVADIEDVQAINEGGLLGIEIDPDFKKNKFVYLYYTYDAEKTLNRVVRFAFDNNSLTEPKTIVDEIPGAAIHNGGRIKFGPDGYLYIAAGDSANPSLAQDKNSKAGKILRIAKDGSVPEDNPFGNLVYSYGHRNPQGLAWDENGNLWATEHGQIATDELNLIEKGKNYGWPDVVGDQTKEGMVSPVVHSGNENWAPSGAVFYKGSIFFAGLRGQSLYEAVLDGRKVKEVKQHLVGRVGRVRDVVVGPDNLLYISTSNRDGRNEPVPEDDRVLRVNPDKLDDK